MNHLRLISAISILLVLATACTQKDKTGLPPSTGAMSEVLIIMPDRQWESTVGFTLKSILGDDVEGLNQAEAMYDPLQIEPADFKGIFLKNRKIIRVTVNDTVSKNQMLASKDVYSSPQIIIDVNASSDTAAIRILRERSSTMIEMMKEVERIRIAKAYESTENIKVTEKMLKQFGFKMVLPESFYEAKTDEGFGWYRLEAAKYSQAVLIYTREFVDSAQFSLNNIIKYRSYITKKYIPGEISGSYMTTDTINGMTARLVPFAGTRATEVRGLWKTEGDFMGGPFLCFTFLDQSSKKVITLEGYVYYPSNDKRDLMMQLEAILYSYRKK